MLQLEVVMGIFDGINGENNNEEVLENEITDKGTVQLRKEELDIAKDRVPTGVFGKTKMQRSATDFLQGHFANIYASFS
ncbi:hypothetical protein GTO91_17415 [Heliobacterium undosum]|uniref:Uncharacterized protein n=1 Tax=Heliomicrobium undosum TaxID=121734 RepID=A0A845L595_9FIRM|nr:hypothetical protein [Heliomicrobium undosum]MZP31473.1 hypothetical protein [Heliomicrobium undosum]